VQAGDEAMVRSKDDQFILQPEQTERLLEVLSRLRPLPEDFPDIDADLPPLDDVDLSEMETAAES
jgi:antitoxin VapB